MMSSGVLVINFEKVSDIVLVFPLLMLSISVEAADNNKLVKSLVNVDLLPQFFITSKIPFV